MNLPKAIEILQKAVDNVPIIPASKLHVAQRLGIEAMKRLIAIRRIIGGLPDQLLPGEES